MKKKMFLMVLFLMSAHMGFSQTTCNSAQNVGAGSHTISIINGIEVPASICADGGAGATAANWYKYVPTQDYEVTVTTNLPINTPVDNRVHIYIGDCSNYSCLAGNDDSNGTSFCEVTFNVTANNNYYIVFDNRWSNAGFVFQLTENVITGPDPNLVQFLPQNITTISGSYKNAMVDMNGDYLDDIVSVSSDNIQIHFQDTGGLFSVQNFPTTNATFQPSWSIAMGDINEDGYNDLLYGGGNGVTFMKSNGLGTGYIQSSGNQYVFSQRSNFVDINNDGHLDAFVCHDVAPNVYYLNDGNGNLTFYQGGLGNHPNGGNYGSIWVDYNNDLLPDLFIAKCRGGNTTAKINELHRNNGDGTFTDVSTQSNMADPVQTWSSAWNDFDNDGWMDAVVGASSSADGMHKFMHNNGNGTFSDITAGSGLDTYTGMAIEYISHDFNNDGFADVLTNGNMLLNNGDNTFSVYSFPMTNGPVADINHDGFLDVQNGTQIFYNSGNANNWITITLKGINTNSNGIGARVELYGNWGKQIRDVRSGMGFRHMGTLNTHFGTGTATTIDSVLVRWPSGNVDIICNPAINSILHIEENSGPTPLTVFQASSSNLFAMDTVAFDDNSTVCPNFWIWTVDPSSGWSFVNGSNANSQNPEILFEQPGSYFVTLWSGNSNGMSNNLQTDTITVNSLVGLNTILSKQLRVYPNPAKDFLQLHNLPPSIASVKITNMLGEHVEAIYSSDSHVLSTSSLSPGVYLATVVLHSGEIMQSRFVKE
ncbi:MAG: FG-GAP-like repeat-containing protein [Bacteroidota bacterium]|jgi:hypothetical protein